MKKHIGWIIGVPLAFIAMAFTNVERAPMDGALVLPIVILVSWWIHRAVNS